MQNCEKINCFEKGYICIPETNMPRIVIVGGGFAALSFIKKLKNKPVQIILIDKNNFHQFLPLLYQVAASGIEPNNIIFPFRKLFDNYNNVTFRMAEVTDIYLKKNRLKTTIGYINYDFLILSNGSTTNYFGNKDIENFGIGLKSVTDSLDIRSKFLQNLEKASTSCNTEEKTALSSIAIIGGGPAGVEMAGAFAEFKKSVLPKDYPELKDIDMKIFLIEAKDRLLQQMPDILQQQTYKFLSQMGIEIMLNTFVKSYDGNKISLEDEKILYSSNFIWTAGICGQTINGLPLEVKNNQNRIFVDSYSKVKSLENVFAIGDIALMKTQEYKYGHPMVAQVAIQQGKTLAINILNIIQQKNLIAFKYHDKGTMATIGKKKAVASIKKMNFKGFFAWIIWSLVHLMSIIGVRNKFLIAFNWLLSYFTYDKNDRVIIHKFKQKQSNT